jgi:ribose 1,5-bisphosphate isomerase
MDYQTISDRIKSLEIQGATSVAKKGLEALELRLKEKEPSSLQEAIDLLETTSQELAVLRSTEPLLRNGLQFILNEAQQQENLEQLFEVVSQAREDFVQLIDAAKPKIAEVGARRLAGTILTHCHSSTAMAVLKKSKDDIDHVYTTETRPRYQGRLTVKQLLESGFKTTMIVDSAARYYMKKMDYVIVGADVITSEGNVINKIGTASIALAAHEARIPFYVATSLLKFNPLTISGLLEEIEERSWEEIWPEKPKELEIHNPAFDVTPANYIDGLITEDGLIPPHMVLHSIRNSFSWILKNKGI